MRISEMGVAFFICHPRLYDHFYVNGCHSATNLPDQNPRFQFTTLNYHGAYLTANMPSPTNRMGGRGLVYASHIVALYLKESIS